MKRKFCQYIALSSALRREDLPDYGALSTILLETFLEDNGRLKASKVYSRQLCEEGQFIKWRKELIQKEWLVWSESQDDKGQYYQGKKLIPYINKEKSSKKELVTRGEVPSKAEFDDLKKEVESIKDSMGKVYQKFNLGEPDPPHYKKLNHHLTMNNKH